MARQNKTKETGVSVADFIHSFVESEEKQQDSFRLMELMSEWSGFAPRMWGPTIIGFGSYHYKYASGHEGDAPIVGFSPRKASFSLYVLSPGENIQELLAKLGKYKKSKACIYFKRLSDLDIPTLKKLTKSSVQYVRKHYTCTE